MRRAVPYIVAMSLSWLASCVSKPEVVVPPVVRQDAATPAPAQPTAHDIARARQSFERGRALSEVGKQAEALQHFEAAAAAYPDWALAHLELARCRMVLDQAEAAVGLELQRALALAPSNPRVHYATGLFHESYGRDSEARRSYRRAIELRPSYPEALFRLGLLEELSGAHAQANAYLEQVLSLDPEHDGARFGCARLAEQLGDVERAEALLRQLMRQDRTNIGYKKQLAALLRRNGKLRKAKKIEAAIERQLAKQQRELRPLKPSRR